MIYQERSIFRSATSLLISLFLAITTLTSVLTGAIAYADTVTNPADQTDQQLSSDTDLPIITTNIQDGQILSSTVPIIETVYEANPLEYSIALMNTDGSAVTINNAPVGITQNPASSDQLTYGWDTTTVANGSYQIVLKASDQFDNVQTLTVQVIVNNQPTPPAYPPITPELTPIPQQAVTPPSTATPKTTPPSLTQPQPTKVLGSRVDSQVAHQIPQPLATPSQPQTAPNTCARFFGVCWYYSVPATAAISAGALWLYRLRNRE